jgi:hypothetical protein
MGSETKWSEHLWFNVRIIIDSYLCSFYVCFCTVCCLIVICFRSSALCYVSSTGFAFLLFVLCVLYCFVCFDFYFVCSVFSYCSVYCFSSCIYICSVSIDVRIYRPLPQLHLVHTIPLKNDFDTIERKKTLSVSQGDTSKYTACTEKHLSNS